MSGSDPSSRGVCLQSPGLPDLASAAPEEFDGPGDRWSPETLLTAAVADCFNLTFSAIAAASRFPYVELTCDAEATLDRTDRITRFTDITVSAHLTIEDDSFRDKALKLLEKAEANCLITNSLNASIDFRSDVSTVRDRTT